MYITTRPDRKEVNTTISNKSSGTIIVFSDNFNLVKKIKSNFQSNKVCNASTVEQTKLAFELSEKSVDAIVIELNEKKSWTALEYIQSFIELDTDYFAPIFAVIDKLPQDHDVKEQPFKELNSKESISDTQIAQDFGVSSVIVKSESYENVLILLENLLK